MVKSKQHVSSVRKLRVEKWRGGTALEDARIVELYWERDEAAIAESSAKYGGYCYQIAFRILALLALPAGVGLSVLSTPIMVLVLPAQREGALAAGPHLRILGIACIFVCLMILTNAILQTYGKEHLPIFTVIVGGVVKIVMNYILVGNPNIGIHGAPWSTLCCYGVIAGLNLFFVWKYSPRKPHYFRLFARPVFASALMGLAACGGSGSSAPASASVAGSTGSSAPW